MSSWVSQWKAYFLSNLEPLNLLKREVVVDEDLWTKLPFLSLLLWVRAKPVLLSVLLWLRAESVNGTSGNNVSILDTWYSFLNFKI